MISQSQVASRLQLENRLLTHPASYTNHGLDVISGLQQFPKSLPPHYFYDELGSQLFEQICELPEYYPTRTEASILAAIADELVTITGPCDFIELGSGSSTKTRLLLAAYQQQNYRLRYLPIDVSESILETSAKAILSDYHNLSIYGLISTYDLALEQLPGCEFEHRLIAFLGSTLGNLSPNQCADFFEQLSQSLQTGDYFLLGIDLQKPIAILEAAYNDRQGITADFNLNSLRHLNWRFQGDFNLANFQHYAYFNQEKSQIEMHLISQTTQTVNLKKLALTVHFEPREHILTEISRKFNVTSITEELKNHQLELNKSWTDPQGWFGLLLFQKN